MKIFVFLMLIVYANCECTKQQTTIAKLKEDITCSYDKTLMPPVDTNKSTTIAIKMILKSISYVSEVNTLNVHTWMAIGWKDKRLSWDPKSYDNIDKMHIGSDSIWYPDLAIYNKASQENPYTSISVDCILSAPGNIICISPTAHDSNCIPNLTYYPFDTQNCTLHFGSWVHSGEEINITFSKPPISLEDYEESGEWELLSVNATKHDGKYECCPNSTYPSLIYDFQLRRHSGMHVASTIIPIFAMVVMALIALWSDPESMERTVMNSANVINHILFLQYMFWQVPISGPQKPLLVLFLRDSLIIVMFNMILTVIERQLIKNVNPIPNWISTVITCITNNRIGQIIFIYNKNLKIVSNQSDEDTSSIIQNAETECSNKDWRIFASIINKFCFIIFLIIYFCMIIAFIP